MSASGTTYYWLGQDKAQSANQENVACYSSTDLVHWKPQGDVLTPSNQNLPNWPSPYQIRTVKVIFNKMTDRYVLWASIATGPAPGKKHRTPANFLLDVATSPRVCHGSDYKWQGHNGSPLPFQPQGNNKGNQPSGDIGVFKDAGGKAYLLSEDEGQSKHDPNRGLYIYALNAQFTGIDTSAPDTGHGVVRHFSQDFEAPALFKSNGTYYVFASFKTSWVPNDNWYAATTARSLTNRDSWSPWAHLVPTPPGGPDPRTCVSQTMDVVPVQGKKKTTYIYIGDRWDSTHQADSGYVWLPITFGGSTPPRPSIDCALDNWSINTATGKSDALKDAYFTFTNVAIDGVIAEHSSTSDVGLSGNNGQLVQQWKIVNLNYPPTSQSAYAPYYQLVNDANGKVLQASSTGPGAKLIQASSNVDFGTVAAREQEWMFASAQNGDQTLGLTLVNVASGLVAQAIGTSIKLEPFLATTTKASQLWALSEVPGYWAVTSVGHVYYKAGIPGFGSLASQARADAVGFVPTTDGSGYWIIESGGKVTNFGDAASFGDIRPSCLLGGATANPGSRGGFWAFGRCGTVYAYGGAPKPYGSHTGKGVTIVGLAATHDGGGYWLVDRSGEVYPFGDAGSKDFSLGNVCPVASAITDPAGGFWALTKCGDIFGEGGAHSLGDEFALRHRDFTRLAATADGGGYWLFEQPVGTGGSGGAVTVYHFGDATGGTGVHSGKAVVATVGDPSK